MLYQENINNYIQRIIYEPNNNDNGQNMQNDQNGQNIINDQNGQNIQNEINKENEQNELNVQDEQNIQNEINEQNIPNKQNIPNELNVPNEEKIENEINIKSEEKIENEINIKNEKKIENEIDIKNEEIKNEINIKNEEIKNEINIKNEEIDNEINIKNETNTKNEQNIQNEINLPNEQNIQNEINVKNEQNIQNEINLPNEQNEINELNEINEDNEINTQNEQNIEENEQNIQNEQNERDTESSTFDDSTDLLDTNEDIIHLVNYRISYINIFYDKNKECIVGIQLTYKNIKTKEIIPIIKRRLGAEIGEEETFKLNLGKNEYISNFSFCRKNKKIVQMRFETNKNRIFEIGKEEGEKIDLLPDKNQKAIILGTYGSINCTNFGILYIKIDNLIKLFYTGFSELKTKLEKDAKYKKQIEEKYDSLSQIDKYIYKAALLPKAPFSSILRYIVCEKKYI